MTACQIHHFHFVFRNGETIDSGEVNVLAETGLHYISHYGFTGNVIILQTGNRCLAAGQQILYDFCAMVGYGSLLGLGVVVKDAVCQTLAVAYKPYFTMGNTEQCDTGGEASLGMIFQILNADAVATVYLHYLRGGNGAEFRQCA